MTSHRSINHPNAIFRQQALPWMVGGRFIAESKRWEKQFSKDYDELMHLAAYPKDKLISIILSRKTFTEGHAKRMAFVQKLKEYFGEDLDVFGVDICEIADKWDGIARYRYHLALENSACEDYWTEKLSDAYLAGSYPFYFGCPNIADYFPEQGFTRIDVNDFDASLEKIKEAIEHQAYEKAIPVLLTAKELVLTKYNLFAVVSEYCTSRPLTGTAKEVHLLPEANRTDNPLVLAKRIISKWLQ
jgi:hypothetical protein